MAAESSLVPKCDLKAVKLIKQLNGTIINRKSSNRKSPSLLQWGNGHQCGGKYLKKSLLGGRFCHRAVCRQRSTLMNTLNGSQATPFCFSLETRVRCSLDCLEIAYIFFYLGLL